MRRDALSRRTVIGGALAAVAALGVGGCRGQEWYPNEITPDEYLLRSAIAEKRRMVARYAVLLQDGTLADPDGMYEGVRARHERHLAALEERLPERPAEPDPSAGPTAPVEPGGGGAAGLRVVEEAAAANRLRQLTEATDPALAQLFAAIGACEAGHARLLSED